MRLKFFLIFITFLFTVSCSDSSSDGGSTKTDSDETVDIVNDVSSVDDNLKQDQHGDADQVVDSGWSDQDSAGELENEELAPDSDLAQEPEATIFVGPQREYKVPSEAAAVAQSGDVVEIDPGVYEDNVATWRADNLIIRGGAGGKAKLDATGMTISNQKGIWVIQGSNVTVDNIEFTGASVPDRNGAGIRYEGSGKLTIRNCYFHHNEMGILTGNQGTEDITIDSSEFHDHGKSNGGFSHNIYIGSGAKFTLISSYSHDAFEGHNVKSRADENHILYNRIVDHSDHPEDEASSYLLDLPEGGLSFVIGNEFHESPKSSNSTLFSYARENRNGPIQQLYVINNTFVNDRSSAIVIGVGGEPEVKIVNNIFDNFNTVIDGNYTGEIENNETDVSFTDRSGMNYNLQQGSNGIDSGVTPGSQGGFDLDPNFEYVHPLSRKVRVINGTIDMGAFEFNP